MVPLRDDDLDATAKFQRIAATGETGTNKYQRALGDAVAEIGSDLKALTNIVTGVRISQARHVDRDEVARIAKEANAPLEGQVSLLIKWVSAVAVGIPVALLLDWVIANHHL